MKRIVLCLIATVFTLPAFGVPENTAPRLEDDPSLEISEPLDLHAEVEGFRSREDLGMEDAEMRYYRENADAIDGELIQEIESSPQEDVATIDPSGEIQGELSSLRK